MKKLYDEIMVLTEHFPHNDWACGYNIGLRQAAELAKKYDDEIERLTRLINIPSKIGDKFY